MARRRRVIDSSDDSESDDGSSSSSGSESQPENGLVDLEAEEAKDGELFATNSDADFSTETFSLFAQLPPELRRRIWEFFCPDLTSKGRILHFGVASLDIPGMERWEFQDGLALQDQTRAVRVLSAVYQESRAIALQKFPDTLSLRLGSGDARVCFNKDRDIALIGIGLRRHSDFLASIDSPSTQNPSFSDKLRHVGIIQDDKASDLSRPFYDLTISLTRSLRNVETVFLCQHHDTLSNRRMRWAGSQFARHYRLETFEHEPGLGEDLESMICWPDFVNHPDFTQIHAVKPFRDDLDEDYLHAMDEMGVKLLPMVNFEYESGLELFERFVADHEAGVPIDLADGDSSSESDMDSHPSQDEYESEGIDDAEIVDEEESSEDELIPRAISPGGSSEGDDAEAAQGVEVDARFSSPEPESPTEDTAAQSRRPKRRIVSESDDDSDGDAPVTKRMRTEPSAVSISSDDDEVAPKQKARARRRAQVISSDHDDNDDESESQTEDEEEEDEPPARLSLAERLRQFRDVNPIPVDEEDPGGSDDDSLDEGEDDDDDDSEDDENGLIDDMAEDSNGESEGGDDDEW